MDKIVSYVVIALFLVLWLAVMIRLVIKTVRSRYAPVKTVRAVVADKHKIETFSKYAGNGKGEMCVVVFSAEGKKLSFYVSEYSYHGYRVGESGTLKYKGDMLIEFG